MDHSILAVNFGHDATLALFVAGHLVAYRELERHTRKKHSVGIAAADIQGFLADAGFRFADLDAVALCSTQWWNAKHDAQMNLSPGYDEAIFANVPPADLWPARPRFEGTESWYCYGDHAARLAGVTQTAWPITLSAALPHYHGLPTTAAEFDQLYARVGDWLATDAADSRDRQARLAPGLYPYVFHLEGEAKPAFFVPHHWAHAGYGAYYLTGDRPGLLVSHDGGWPYFACNAGAVYLRGQHGVYPILDPGLFVGQLYQRCGELAGFHPAEAPGKLMGLSAYGQASPESDGIVDALLALTRPTPVWTLGEFERALADILGRITAMAARHRHILAAAEAYHFNFQDRDFSISLAAHAQAIVENTWERALAPLLGRLRDRFELSDSVPIVGGFALNCPANSRLQAALPDMRLSPLPGCGDMGTAIGAGVVLSSFLSGQLPRAASGESAAFPPRPATRREVSAAGLEALAPVTPSEPLATWYAQELLAGKIFCHLEGDSETGPRALGHRSIIAHGVLAETRDYINRKKRREAWRPLAPLVRLGDFQRFFSGSPESAEFMLFTYRVLADDIPAVTHVDGTARGQSIASGTLFEVLTEMEALGALPVMINTSFNVAGEPIVETHAEAIRSFLTLGFDYLYLDGQLYQPRAENGTV